MNAPRRALARFSGALVAADGLLTLAAGLVAWKAPPRPGLVLHELHASVWLGALLTVAGLATLASTRPRRTDHDSRR